MAKEENDCPFPKGTLILIGGKEEKVIKTISEEGNGPGKMEILETLPKTLNKPDPIIEVITTASSEGEEVFQDYKNASQVQQIAGRVKVTTGLKFF